MIEGIREIGERKIGSRSDNYNFSKIEKVEISIITYPSFQLKDARAIRGFFGNIYRNRPEFHGHKDKRFVYKHPLIQYKVLGVSSLIIGLKDGAYLLKALPRFKKIEIHYKKYRVLQQDIKIDLLPFGLSKDMINYTFITPWLGLNEKNYMEYLILKKKGVKKEIDRFLGKIIIGNILSLSKSVGYVVNNPIYIESSLEEYGTVQVKDGVNLIGFTGQLKANFFIPDLWGIGKFSSRGYGVVRCNKGDK